MNKYHLREHLSPYREIGRVRFACLSEGFLWDAQLLYILYEEDGGMENEINDKPLAVGDDGKSG